MKTFHLILALLALGVTPLFGATYTNDIAPGAQVDLTSAQGIADGGTIALQCQGPLEVQMQTGGSGVWLTVYTANGSATTKLNVVGSTVRLRVPATAQASTAVAASISDGNVGAAGTPSGNVSSVQGVSNGTPLAVQGPASAGSAVSTNPVMVGLVARTANSPVINGTGIYPISTLAGAQVGKPYSIPEADWIYVPPAGGLNNSATPVTIIASAGAGLRNYVTGLSISSDALGAACDIAVLDSTGAVFLYRHHLTTAGVPAGINVVFPTPLRGPAATALTIKTLVGGTGTAVSGAIYVNVQGYQAP